MEDAFKESFKEVFKNIKFFGSSKEEPIDNGNAIQFSTSEKIQWSDGSNIEW
jgi:hypothetical protein